MKKQVSLSRLHEEILQEVFPKPPSDNEAFRLMLLLHVCRIRLSDEARLKGYPKLKGHGVEGISISDAASVVASLFPSGDKSLSGYWFWKFHELEAYGLLNDIPVKMRDQFARLKRKIEKHAWVDAVEEVDFDIFPRD